MPPAQGGQLAWSPLERAVRPGFLTHPQTQADLVGFLLARGADPSRKLFYDAGRTIAQQARALNSPVLALLESPRAVTPPTTLLATVKTVTPAAGE